MAVSERSAGFIVFIEHAGERRFLLLDYGKHWDYPKGHVEKGEDDLAAARRELAEETGVVDIEIVHGFSHAVDYFFRHPKRGLIHKTVVLFLACGKSADVQLSHEHVGHAFLPAEAAVAKLTYRNAREALQHALSHLDMKRKIR